MLNSDPTQTQNEQLIASTAALILTIIRNRATSEELLITSGICPQKRKRKRQLFSTHNSTITHSDSYAPRVERNKNKRDLLLENKATISSHGLFDEEKQQPQPQPRSDDGNALSKSLPSPVMPVINASHGKGKYNMCLQLNIPVLTSATFTC